MLDLGHQSVPSLTDDSHVAANQSGCGHETRRHLHLREPANRARLEAIIADRNSSSKAVWRAEIVLATADGLGTNAIMRARANRSRACGAGRSAIAEEGVDGLLRDKTRPPGKKPLSAEGQAQGAGQDSQRDAGERDALERAVDGGGDGHQPLERAAHLGRGRPEAAPGAPGSRSRTTRSSRRR